MTRKSLVAVWRDAVRDSVELDRTAKLVAFCLSTYLNGHGFGWPSQDTLAAGASITDRAVYSATLRLESTGFLEIERSRGRSSHRYVATLPATANAVRRSEWANSERHAPNSERHAPNSERHAPNSERHAPNPERRSPESVESAESGVLDATAALGGAVARTLIEDECGRCGKRLPLVDDIYCVPCAAKVQADRLIAGVRRDLDDAGKDGR